MRRRKTAKRFYKNVQLHVKQSLLPYENIIHVIVDLHFAVGI